MVINFFMYYLHIYKIENPFFVYIKSTIQNDNENEYRRRNDRRTRND